MVVQNAPAAVGCGASGAGLSFVKRKKPDWLRVKMAGGQGFKDTLGLVEQYQLNTVCQSAKCPNLGDCWDRGTATMMILGDTCTRACRFCHVKTGRPPEYDLDEPRRVGEAVGLMRLKHIVITSVDRDELPDGGAEVWAETIREIRRFSPKTQVEVLIPDFQGDWDALQIVLDERPDILAHNMETVSRLYKVVRPQAAYQQSIELLRRAKAQGLTVKTGIMVGIGEREGEVEQLVDDLVAGVSVPGVGADDAVRAVADHWQVPDPNRGLSPELRAEAERRSVTSGDRKADTGEKLRRGGYLVDHDKPYWNHHAPAAPANAAGRLAEVAWPERTYPGVHETLDILTVGQYLQPTNNHLPISRWVKPSEFVAIKEMAEARGIRHCESGPLVRSSYHAEEQVLKLSPA